MEYVVLSPADADRLLEFYQTLSAAVVDTYQPFPEVSLATMNDHLAGAAAGKHISMAVEEAGRIWGHSFIMNINEEHPVFGIGISDSHQNEGLGRGLMTRIIEHGDGLKSISLTVLKYNTRALTLYKSFNFKIVSDHTFREANDSHFMIRTGGTDSEDRLSL
ncbi:MAG: GNAT family N-acetyltransferase [Spirochaetales bacterium]|jgi:ribosomal protein S18 acetylase RimI-like enzyme|nr:GNAT family N-acetyltransferase [Spirochaetales bacterium]